MLAPGAVLWFDGFEFIEPRFVGADVVICMLTCLATIIFQSRRWLSLMRPEKSGHGILSKGEITREKKKL